MLIEQNANEPPQAMEPLESPLLEASTASLKCKQEEKQYPLEEERCSKTI